LVFPSILPRLSAYQDDRVWRHTLICIKPRLFGQFDTRLPRRHLPYPSARVSGSCRFRPVPSSQASLMGFVKDSLPPTSPLESTPRRAVARLSAHRIPYGALVPSLSFHPTPTVYSSCAFAGLLHPAADHRVRCVLVSCARHKCRTRRS